MVTRATTSGRAFASSVLATSMLLRDGQLRLPREHVGARIHFADGATSRVYRETVRLAPIRDPAVLVVRFRLRLVGHDPRLHAAFRAESLANTFLFAGFPGFRTKYWMTDEGSGQYRGLYDWDGPELARDYATTLSRLLGPVCLPGSVDFHVEPDTRRDAYLEQLPPRAAADAPAAAWWLPVGVEAA